MIPEVLAYGAFVLACIATFLITSPARAALILFFGGWLALPVAVFQPTDLDVSFPYWITGLAIPSDILVGKAWIIPTVILLCIGWRIPNAVAGLRLSAFDMAIVLFCFWPLVQSGWISGMDPSGVIASAYLLGTWGSTWLIGKLLFATSDLRRKLLAAMSWSGVACAPIALVEGIYGPAVYEWLYNAHPFRTDGAERYFGFRPLGFFEHGNQYGLWVAMAAIAGTWLFIEHKTRMRAAVAAATWVLCLASQSALAIMLAVAACLLLFIPLRLAKAMVVIAAAFTLVAGAVHFSGIVPVERIARGTAAGQWIIDAFRVAGRGSFPWRISQDLKTLPIVRSNLLLGTGVWDWWRPIGIRPWGLWLLLAGQFGLIGAVSCAIAWIGPPLKRIMTLSGTGDRSVYALAIIVLAAFGDSLFNSFLYFPALLAAGGLASSRQEDRATRS